MALIQNIDIRVDFTLLNIASFDTSTGMPASFSGTNTTARQIYILKPEAFPTRSPAKVGI